jgi:hypothetical protein
MAVADRLITGVSRCEGIDFATARSLAPLSENRGSGVARDDPAQHGVPTERSCGKLSLDRIDDDKSRHSRVNIAFYTRGGKRLSHTYRAVATNRWVRFRLLRQMQRFTGYVCAQGTDGTDKASNMACAGDVVG